MSLTDDVAAAREGDREAFGRLVGPRLPRLVRLARSIVGDGPADDVVQDACMAGWRHLAQLEDPEKFDNWFTRIVYRSALRTARWNRLRASVFYPPRDVENPGAEAARVDQAADLAVWQVLSKLPARQRAVLHLTVVEGMTDSEIARALGIRASSVRAHRRRARARVAALWNGHAAGEPG
jgi:RNA polymerase sigma-70 factor (ECF subfamily)